MKSFGEYQAYVEHLIDSLNFPGEDLKGLYEPISYGLEKGGKRIRPILTLMACEAFCGDYLRASSQAVGVEMFHNFTLLHDDVMDNSSLRRGRPTVVANWDMNTAILSGDTMLTLATREVCKVEDVYLRRVLETFNDVAIKVYEGQQLDMDFETSESVTLEQYLEMIRLKTSVLLGGAAKIGAIVGDASEADAHAMYRYAEAMGLAFQIQDDYLDVYGNPATFGKPIGGDILNRKKTYLVLALMEMGQEAVDDYKNAMSIRDDKARIDAVRGVYTAYGIPEVCRSAILRWSSEAIEALEVTSLSEVQKRCFEDLVNMLIVRDK